MVKNKKKGNESKVCFWSDSFLTPFLLARFLFSWFPFNPFWFPPHLVDSSLPLLMTCLPLPSWWLEYFYCYAQSYYVILISFLLMFCFSFLVQEFYNLPGVFLAWFILVKLQYWKIKKFLVKLNKHNKSDFRLESL